MELITYYNFIKHKEVENRNQYNLKDQNLLYRNFLGYTFLTIYGKKLNDNEIEVYFFYTNNNNFILPSRLKAYKSGDYYCIADFDQLPEMIQNKLFKNGVKLKGIKHFYLHRVLVAISLDINNLEIHHIDRNSLNDRIDNLLPVTKEEHDLIHELEKEFVEITYSSQIAKKGSITSYTRNLLAYNIKENKLSTQIVADITGKPLKEINNWMTDYKKYGRVGSRKQPPVSNVFKLPDFYILQLLKHYYIDHMTLEQTREELSKSRLLNPKTKKPVTTATIKKYIDGHPHFVEWYNTYNDE